METLEQKKRRLFGKKHLESYLIELNKISNLDINKHNLLSIVESDKVFFDSENALSKKIKLPFYDKERILIFIGDLIKLKDGDIYLWTSYSDDCGLLSLKSLKEFNVNFDFSDEHAGLITIVLKDLSNKLLLDFYKEDNIEFIEIEVYGNDWSKAIMLED